MGDIIEVYVVKKETDTGLVSLSKVLADRMRGWSDISEAFKKQLSISGTFISSNRAGLIVDLGGNITGFIPISQMGMSPGKKSIPSLRNRFG